jgi:hypothetical protein
LAIVGLIHHRVPQRDQARCVRDGFHRMVVGPRKGSFILSLSSTTYDVK